MTITQELNAAPAAEQPFHVGPNIFEMPLGAGGMAEVWLGRHVHLGTPVAVNFLDGTAPWSARGPTWSSPTSPCRPRTATPSS